jgi:glycosyltransferase involved in cell wall biosynthesis
MKIINVYSSISNTTIPYELSKFMANEYNKITFIDFKALFNLNLLKTINSLISLIKDETIIHTHHTFSAVIVSLVKILSFNKKAYFIHTCHRDFSSFTLKYQVLYCLLIYPFRDKLICNSRSTKYSLPKFIRRLFGKKIEIIYNGLNFKKIKFQNNLAYQKKIELVNVGRLIKEKDQLSLLKACLILKNEKVNFHLTICGGGDLFYILDEYIKSNNLTNNVSLLGNTPRTDVFGFLKKADFYISTSITEGFGVSNVEAMAAGACVILTDIPVNYEIINDERCFIPIGCANSLTNKIKELLANKELYNELVIKNYERSKMFSLETTAQNHFKVYNDLLIN